METKLQKDIVMIALIVTAALVTILVAVGIINGGKQAESPVFKLAAHEGNVVLYHNGEIDTVYGEIVLDDLPAEDVRMLESGIAFSTREEAERAAEDYDG